MGVLLQVVAVLFGARVLFIVFAVAAAVMSGACCWRRFSTVIDVSLPALPLCTHVPSVDVEEVDGGRR